MTTYGSLFSGVGGLDLAVAEHYAARPIWFCENDQDARRVLAAHWPNIPIHHDVRTLPDDLERPDILAGGFPCQDISYAGTGTGLEGASSGLWYAMADTIGVLRPRIVILENVAAIAFRGGPEIVGTLTRMGYNTSWGTVRASDAGACHRRTRWFAVAHLADTSSSRR